jgi:hypothetical protein
MGLSGYQIEVQALASAAKNMAQAAGEGEDDAAGFSRDSVLHPSQFDAFHILGTLDFGPVYEHARTKMANIMTLISGVVDAHAQAVLKASQMYADSDTKNKDCMDSAGGRPR